MDQCSSCVFCDGENGYYGFCNLHGAEVNFDDSCDYYNNDEKFESE